MSDDTTSEEPGGQQAPRSDVGNLIDGLGSGERLFALGAALIVVDYLLFELILEEYSFFTGTLLVAAIGLFAVWVRHSRSGASWPVPYGWVAKLLGYMAVFLGLIELLADLRLGILDNGADVIGGLGLYAGAVLMLLGSRQSTVGGGPNPTSA